jgi:hypothetical protein
MLSKFLGEYLVSNYYEYNGNFSGINTTNLMQFIEQTSANRTVDDVCYESLGYSGVGNLSAKDVALLRKDIMKALLNNCKLEDIKEYKSLIVAGGTYIDPRVTVINHNYGELNDIFELLYRYYCDCCHSEFTFKEYRVNFHENLATFRISGKRVASLYDSLKESNTCMKYSRTNDDISYISNNVLITNKTFSESMFNKIDYAAFRCAIQGKTAVLTKLKVPYGNLPIVRFVNREKYLILLDIASAAGITYKELLSEIGINVADQLTAYDTLGYAIISLSDDNLVTAIDNNCTESSKYVRKVLI